MAGYAAPQRHEQAQFFQNPSPTSENFTDSAIGSDTMVDTKDRLQGRWNEMMKRMAQTPLADQTVTAIHEHLDNIENLLSKTVLGTEREDTDMSIGLGISGVEVDDSEYTTEHTTPTAHDAPEPICRPDPKGETLAHSQALLERVARAVEQLRFREEEFRHLHDIAMTKAEAGAHRILQLESEVRELENESTKDQSELTFLKLNLRMLEIQADPYIPKDDKDGLKECIKRWKLDWADVDQRRRARRRKKPIEQ